jgi:hypothetical protein
MNPVEKGDALAALGYTVKRTETPGTYLVRNPRGVTYRTDAANGRCSCPASVYCCHLVHCAWHWSRDRAAADLAEARRRKLVIVEEYEDSLTAAEMCLAAILARGAADERREGRAA